MTTVGLIGCGYWGPNLIRNMNALPDVRVKYACDTNPQRLKYIGDQYPDTDLTKNPADIYGDKEVDAVLIATPVSTHYALADEALSAGKHVFVEKPLVAAVADGKALVEKARKKKRTLMVGHTFVYTPQVRKIKEIIASGDIGKVNYVASRRLNLGLLQKDINVAWDLAPHDLSIILYLLGETPVSVNCTGCGFVGEAVEETVVLSMKFANGEFAVVHNSWIDPRKVREMTIVGSNRMIVYNDMEPLEKIKIFDKRVDVPPHYDTFAEFHYSYHYGDVYSPYLKQVEPLRTECAHFIDCIKTSAVPDSSGEEGLKVVKILEAAEESLRNGGVEIAIVR